MRRLTSISRNPHASMRRRAFLQATSSGLGSIALTSILNAGSPSDTAPTPHFTPRARRVIWLFMHGGPSHVDLFDEKPQLVKHAGQPLPESVGEVMTRRKVARNPLLPPVRQFHRHGESGLSISEFLPHTAKLADELCVIHSCHGDSVNHPQSVYQMNTGSILMGKPSLGSWLAYGLGSENRDLPMFVVMTDKGGGIKGGPPAWGSGFLPPSFQGTPFRPGANPLLHLSPPSGIAADRQQRTLTLAQELNAEHLQLRPDSEMLEARIRSYELAFRMQMAAPDVVDLTDETPQTQTAYGLDRPETQDFGTRCLLARRLVERGVRFVQLYSGDTNGWDAHQDVAHNHGKLCAATDQPIAALLRDLRQRGLLDETLVIWGGEFGRMPMSEQGRGRDHNPWGYTIWMAGAGIRRGTTIGKTDDFGLRAVERPVHVHDLHATILHVLGLDHTRLTFFHNGRDERLTDVHGNVVREALA